MELSKKILVIIIVISSGITAFAIAVIANFGGLGTTLAGLGGPLSKGAYSFFSAPFQFVLAHGWPSLAIGIAVFLAWGAFCGYMAGHHQIPILTKSSGNQTGAGSYQSSPSQNIIPIENLQSEPSKEQEEK